MKTSFFFWEVEHKRFFIIFLFFPLNLILILIRNYSPLHKWQNISMSPHFSSRSWRLTSNNFFLQNMFSWKFIKIFGKRTNEKDFFELISIGSENMIFPLQLSATSYVVNFKKFHQKKKKNWKFLFLFFCLFISWFAEKEKLMHPFLSQ